MTKKKPHSSRVYDPTLHPRHCTTCGKLLVGYTDYGLTWWMDAEPVTPAVEQVYALAGRRTYLVRPQPTRGAWVDLRMRADRWPSTGVVLVEHLPGHVPGSHRAAAPEWMKLPARPATAPTATDTFPF